MKKCNIKTQSALSVLGLILFVTLYLILNYPGLAELYHDHQREREVKNKEFSHVLVPPRQESKIRTMTSDNVLGDIMRKAQENSMRIKEVRFVKRNDDRTDGHQWVSLVSECEFQAFLGFIDALSQLSYGVYSKDIAIRVLKKGDIIVSTLLLVDQRYSAPLNQARLQKRSVKNLFVWVDKKSELVLNDEIQNDETPLNKVSVNQLEYAGSLFRGGQLSALIRSSRGGVVLVSMGAKIGLEAAEIIQINDNDIILRSHGRQIKLQ